MAVLITKGAPPRTPGSRSRFSKGLKGLQGAHAVLRRRSKATPSQTEAAFFVSGARCTSGCDPEETNFITFRGSVKKRSLLRGAQGRGHHGARPRGELKPSEKAKEEPAAGEEGGEGEGYEESPDNNLYFDVSGVRPQTGANVCGDRRPRPRGGGRSEPRLHLVGIIETGTRRPSAASKAGTASGNRPAARRSCFSARNPQGPEAVDFVLLEAHPTTPTCLRSPPRSRRRKRAASPKGQGLQLHALQRGPPGPAGRKRKLKPDVAYGLNLSGT